MVQSQAVQQRINLPKPTKPKYPKHQLRNIMADDDDDDVGQKRSPRGGAAAEGENSGPAMGPIYIQWENSLEKLKILGYEAKFCTPKSIKPFSRVHFVFPGANQGIQFNDFIEICVWLFVQITGDSGTFARDTYDDPNTVANKLMLALRSVECKLAFPAQKLKTPHGEAVCSVLEFLTDKALEKIRHQWKHANHVENDRVEQADVDNEDNEEDVEDDGVIGVEEDLLSNEVIRDDAAEVSLDIDAHQILHAQVDPVLWKTELERVGPKLRAQQQLATNEWRAHVDQTINSKTHIERVLGDTEGDLRAMQRDVSDELGRMRTKEVYINKQFALLCGEFKEIKQKLEEAETSSKKATEKVTRLTNELNEHTERLDELKESFESKDSGIHDTSPLVRIKSALQQIKQETQAFDLRIGVVSHALLAEKVNSMARRRFGAAKRANRRNKGKKQSDRDGGSSGDDDMYL
eukprot:gene9888-20577_t